MWVKSTRVKKNRLGALAEVQLLFNRPWLLGIVLALVLAAAMDTGQRVASYSHIQEDANRKEQMTAIRDGLFVLLSLLLGFTLALAAPRYNERRSLLIEEATAIETAYLRAGTLPEPYREQAQQLLRQYVSSRIDFNNAGLDSGRLSETSNRSKGIQEQLWEGVTEAAKADRTAILATYINSLNEIIGVHQKRMAALEYRIPVPIWFLIISVSLIAVFARGLTLAGPFWLTLVIAPLTIAIVVSLIADLDTPSTGLIRMDQRAMLRLQSDINHPQ
jgi:hypothetical protein